MRRAAAALCAALSLLTACGAAETAAPASGPITAEGYTAQQICDYFAELAFGSEFGGYRGTVCKWTKEIVCHVSGDYAEGEITVLTDIMERLCAIPGFPGVRMTEDADEANFTVAFVMQNELKELFGEAAENSSGMTKFYWTKKGGEIVRAEVGIASNITPMNAKASVICEEFLQALGLCCDSYTYPESVFYEGYNGRLRPAEIDWALLALLYSEKIPPAASKEDAMEQVRILLGMEETMQGSALHPQGAIAP